MKYESDLKHTTTAKSRAKDKKNKRLKAVGLLTNWVAWQTELCGSLQTEILCSLSFWALNKLSYWALIELHGSWGTELCGS